MELHDYFPIDGIDCKSKDVATTTKEFPFCEANRGAIFSWKWGRYTQLIYDELISAFEKYGLDYDVNKTDSDKQMLVFTRMPEKCLEFIRKFLKGKQQVFFFLTEKEISDNSFIKDFFYCNDEIDYNLLASFFIEDFSFSQIDKLARQNSSNEFLWQSLVVFRKLQKKYNLNPSFLLDLRQVNLAFIREFLLEQWWKKPLETDLADMNIAEMSLHTCREFLLEQENVALEIFDLADYGAIRFLWEKVYARNIGPIDDFGRFVDKEFGPLRGKNV
jgi:hypothetical protein